MQRTFNYTGRKRITREHVKFELIDSLPAPKFSVLLNLPANELPGDASVFIDAYCKETRQRFAFGKVARIEPPADLSLDEIDLSAPTQFRVSVVDESGKHGKILASGEGFKPSGDEDEDNKSSLLPVRSRQMGEVVWKIELDTGGKPELCINSKIPDGIHKIKTDPLFQAAILPAALREVLTQYVWRIENFEEDVNCGHWMNFAELLAGPGPESKDELVWSNWIDEAVEEFSSRFNMCELLCAALESSDS